MDACRPHILSIPRELRFMILKKALTHRIQEPNGVWRRITLKQEGQFAESLLAMDDLLEVGSIFREDVEVVYPQGVSQSAHIHFVPDILTIEGKRYATLMSTIWSRYPMAYEATRPIDLRVTVHCGSGSHQVDAAILYSALEYVLGIDIIDPTVSEYQRPRIFSDLPIMVRNLRSITIDVRMDPSTVDDDSGLTLRRTELGSWECEPGVVPDELLLKMRGYASFTNEEAL